MHREIVQASLPCLIALVIGFVILWLLALFSGAKFKPRRLWSLHRCQSGAVQSLSFVLTLPAFLLVMIFIIQVSQLMIGIIIVHYAAYAGARSAAVWIPAEAFESNEMQNVIAGKVVEDPASPDTLRIWFNDPTTGRKYDKIRQAVVMACAPICPSRDLQNGSPNVSSWVMNSVQTTASVYKQMAPGQQSNPRISARIQNKLTYSDQNTFVIVQWLQAWHPERDIDRLTYNPRGHRNPSVLEWNPNEVGWQDPITIHAIHNFALLSSAGKFLAARLVQTTPETNRVAELIAQDKQRYKETVYSIQLGAACTLTNEGIKSVVPYVQP